MNQKIKLSFFVDKSRGCFLLRMLLLFSGRPVPGVVSVRGRCGQVPGDKEPGASCGGSCQESLDPILMVSDHQPGPDAKLDNKPHYVYNGSRAIIR